MAGTQGFYVDWGDEYLITVCHASGTTHIDVPMAHHIVEQWTQCSWMNYISLELLEMPSSESELYASNLFLISKSCCLSCRFKYLNFQPLSSLISGNFVTSVATTTVLHAWLNFLSNAIFDGITHLVCSGACLWSIWSDDLNYKTSLHF